MLMDMNSKIQYPYLGYLLRGRVDKAEPVQLFGVILSRLEAGIFLFCVLFLVG